MSCAVTYCVILLIWVLGWWTTFRAEGWKKNFWRSALWPIAIVVFALAQQNNRVKYD